MRAFVMLQVMALVVVLGLSSSVAVPEDRGMAEDAAVVCTQHLQAIGRALDAYQRDHGELPENLSDLYPKCLADKEVFHCPGDASPGSPAIRDITDPKMPISYLYEMSVQESPFPGVYLGPRRTRSRLTWREGGLLARLNFGDRVPLVRCVHHDGTFLSLTASGQVYRGAPDWDIEPAGITVMLDHLEHDLAAGPAPFCHNWAPEAIDEYCDRWMDSPLPPALRYRLGSAADRLLAAAKALPTSSRCAACSLAARFYGAAGQTTKVIDAAEEALRHPGDHEAAKFFLADARYRASQKHGGPPIDELVRAEMAKYHVPGLSIGVVRNGKVILAKGYGLANVELGVPASPDTIYEIGSLSKQFTAAAIMLLVEEGKISLDERVSKYLPDLPAAWGEVTVRHLLTHTSGVPNYGGGDYDKLRGQDVTPSEIIKTVADRPLDFHPGERYAYSNTNYTLLGMTIERISGKPYGEFMTEHIFQPMGMSATRLNDLRLVVKNRASGYSWEDESLRNREYWSASHFYSSGGIVSSVMDLLKWQAVLSARKLLKPSSWEQMWTPQRLNDGKSGSYALGWQVESAWGHRVIHHYGGKPGFAAAMRWFPDDQLTVIALANTDSFAVLVPLPNAIARYLLPQLKPIEEKGPETTRRLKEVLAQLADGHADPTQFTPEAQSVLLPEISRVTAFYRSLGPLKSFRVIEQTSDEKARTYLCWTVFRHSAWMHQFVLTPDGKIAELSIQPE
jgi:CubicO group peptidase (beta-lactamase class C family)